MIATDSENKTKFQQLSSSSEKLWKEVYASLDLIKKLDPTADMNSLNITFSSMVNLQSEIEDMSNKIEAASSARLQRDQRISIIVLFIISKILIRDIAVPVGKITDFILEFEKGNLHSDIDYESQDEFGELCSSIKSSTLSISSYIDEIGRIMGELSEGNLTVKPKMEFMGDFKNIQLFIENFVSKISSVIMEINDSATKVS